LKGLSTKKTIERRGTMFDLIKKTMLTGVGLVFMTKDRIEELVEELTKKGELTVKEGKELLDDLLKKSTKAKKDLEKQIEKVVKNSMKKMNLADAQELSKLMKRVKKLEEALKEKNE
jgi:polyhydroxyalkanoate synthesis regulator phasin